MKRLPIIMQKNGSNTVSEIFIMVMIDYSLFNICQQILNVLVRPFVWTLIVGDRKIFIEKINYALYFRGHDNRCDCSIVFCGKYTDF